ncbi:MAG TPA: GH1 family beta-glucosidase [Streptosporangiaceae bacterium]|jgi:beta-glucosidase
MTDAEFPRFPPGFVWGVATAAYQIEGAVAEDGRGVSIWDTFCQQPGAIKDGQTGDLAADHYHRWAEDVALMADLGIGAYRFSLAWPRIQPDGSGPANEVGLDFYDRLTDALLARGISPMPTLYHWDLPQPLEDVGGWMTRDTAYRFADYAVLAADRLADRIPLWITLNEPFVVTAFGYALGIHAPGKALMLDSLATAHHQLLGHGLATAAIRESGSGRVAITNNYSPAWPASDSAADLAAAAAYDVLHNRMFTDPVLLGRYPDLSAFGLGTDGPACVQDGDLAIISTPIDALGVNYYNPTRLSALPDSPLPFQMEPIPGYPITHFGWPVIPSGLTELLTTLKERYTDRLPPVYITENGCSVADEPDAGGLIDDQPRIRYLDSHIRAVADAMTAGVDVRGYLAWTLMDNFEWAEGYSQRFGLAYVDFDSQRRIPKSSFTWYRDLIAAQLAAR